MQELPIQRLAAMNPAAIELYRSHNIDLAAEPLEIAICAQHNNGGLAGDCWWQSNIRHLYPIGEVNGTHGVYRPGGTALNAGQVAASERQATLHTTMRLLPRRTSSRCLRQPGNRSGLQWSLACRRCSAEAALIWLQSVQHCRSACPAAVR